MKRSKSGLIPPAPPKEPDTGPGSATCFCRVMDRRGKSQDARQELYRAAYVPEVAEDVAIFSDWKIDSQKALDGLYEQMSDRFASGPCMFRVRVQVTE